MAKASPIQSSFNAGEFSPLMYARVDFDKYHNALKTCLNAVGLIHGPWMRRSGTMFVSEVKDSTSETHLIPFEFNVTQAYMLEFGDQYMRVYLDRAQVLSGASAYEIVTPYAAADVAQLQYAQSADVLYLAHPDYAPRKLTRTGHTSWTLSTIDFEDGPYTDANTTSTTLGISGTTLTASSTTGINRGAGFQAGDVGRHFRIWDGSNYAWGKITAVGSTTSATVNLVRGTAPITATDVWSLGAWCDNTGYPAAVTFFEERLWWVGGVEFPQMVAGSKVGDYENHAPSDPDGTVLAASAVTRTLNATQVNVARWVVDDEKGLLIGTTGGEWVVRASIAGEAITPANITAKRSETKGSAAIQPVRAGKSAVFVQRASKKIQEMAYVFDVDGFRSPDVTVYAEHITGTGVTRLAYQKEPYSLLWAVRKDGVLLSCTYDRAQDVVGWHRHVIGGQSDANGADAVVESIAVIPAPDGLREDLWLVVKRYIDGGVKRYIEYLTPFWVKDTPVEDSFFVDCGLTYDGSPATTISGLDHLEGETVTILADGSTHPDEVVSGGSITLDRSASKVHIGFGYNSDGHTLRPEAGARDGTSQGKTKRNTNVTFRLQDTVGLKYGRSADELFTLPFRKTTDKMGEPVPLFNGDKFVNWPAGYDTDGSVYWRQDLPLPMTVLAIMPQLVTQDR